MATLFNAPDSGINDEPTDNVITTTNPENIDIDANNNNDQNQPEQISDTDITDPPEPNVANISTQPANIEGQNTNQTFNISSQQSTDITDPPEPNVVNISTQPANIEGQNTNQTFNISSQQSTDITDLPEPNVANISTQPANIEGQNTNQTFNISSQQSTDIDDVISTFPRPRTQTAIENTIEAQQFDVTGIGPIQEQPEVEADQGISTFRVDDIARYRSSPQVPDISTFNDNPIASLPVSDPPFVETREFVNGEWITTNVDEYIESLEQGYEVEPITQDFIEQLIEEGNIDRIAADEANLIDSLTNTSPSVNSTISDQTNPSVNAGVNAARNSNALYETPIAKSNDWRFRISLAPNANYLYRSKTDPGILKPLIDTQGVLFPYVPRIDISYAANYDSTDIPHTNYKIYNYRNSAIEQISINGEFSAQDGKDAAYLLAVIHFFRSVTKMFYGQSVDVVKGTPPPICFLNGYGDYNFNNHPVVITNFSLNYKEDVDYITADLGDINANGVSNNNLIPTRIPTKLQIQLSCLPIVTRRAISNNFDLQSYATGKLLLGKLNSGIGGLW